MPKTLSYYDRHAARFFDETIDIDMSATRNHFLAYLPAGAAILDAGCGSGRDAAAFMRAGYQVSAFDGSPGLAAVAAQRLGLDVAVKRFEDLTLEPRFDGIWACASLLHLPARRLSEAFQRLSNGLRPNGVLYASFKYGSGERSVCGRHFTDLDEDALAELLKEMAAFRVLEVWVAADQRPERSGERWLNALLRRSEVGGPAYLTTGGTDDPFLPKLLHAIQRATEIDLAVAFIKSSGLGLIFDALAEAVTLRGARLRVLTSDYLDVTDPDALRKLLLLGDEGADARVFEARERSFHLKAYIFVRVGDGETLEGEAYVGSSNISRVALTDGLEWNYRICHRTGANEAGAECLQELRKAFAALFSDSSTVPLTHAWIEAYEQRRIIRRLPIAPGADDGEPASPPPNHVQAEALDALATSRAAGYQRGLVVLATGLGKTYLAAFDTERFGADRVLFVAHREEILLQAETTFQRVRPKVRVGRYTGTRRDGDVDLLFASVQTLGQKRHLEDFSATHFDYIVVDEFHHAAASTYRRLLQHFRPKFLLGLTATPERTDQSDILSFCDDNLIYSYGLFDGVSAGLLCPFTYHGILDEHVNYEEIPWRNG